MLTDRSPYHAGRFYPGTPEALDRQLDALLPARPSTPARGLMVPHAGYVYSGAVAGAAFAATEVPERVVLLGPKHTRAGAAMAMDVAGRWRLPGGQVDIDAELAEHLRAALPEFVPDDAAQAREHSLEVQIPFLRRRNPDARVVPLLIGRPLSGADCVALGQRLADALCGLEDVLLVASTDLHHQGLDDLPRGSTTWDEVRQRSARALEHVDAFDPAGLVERCRAERISMCGVLPTAVTMAACRALGAHRAERLEVTDSHAVAGGDGRWVVGYASYRFTGS